MLNSMGREQCDVAIVGAGPVGLFLALLLHRQGVRVHVVERQKSVYPLPRAVLFDHESRRLFGLIGLGEEVDEILENVIGQGGEDGTNFVWRDADLKLIVDLYTEAPTRSGFPSVNGFSQPVLESLLEAAVIKRGIPLTRGYELIDIEQGLDNVSASFSIPDREGSSLQKGTCKDKWSRNGHVNGSGYGCRRVCLHLQSRYLIGCDGANSTVRRLEGLAVTDLNFENDWLIVDLVLRNGYLPPLVKRIGTAQICDPQRPTTTVFGGRGRKRFEFMRLPGESRDYLLREETLWELFERWGFTKDNCDVERKVIYTFKARWANEFYRNRVILAGDALHLMPPFIGQGLNSGFRDAAALAWRLPMILSGTGGKKQLLSSYQSERMGHLRKLTEDCIRLGEVVCETDPEKSKRLHHSLRQHPPGKTYDPPLGKPGILTNQGEAGRLSLQRTVRVPGAAGGYAAFDDIHGYGWRLVVLGAQPEALRLSVENYRFFSSALAGKVVYISEEDNITGGYREWFEGHMGHDCTVLVRPDFYVFGHSPCSGVDDLVNDLRSKLGG